MFDINQIYKIDNFLDDAEIQGFDHFCEHYVWEFGAYSYDTSRVFWIKDLWQSKWGQCESIEQTFRTKLETLFGVKLITERMYLNGQAHGQCGSIHSDVTEESDANSDYITLVYYVNKQWSPEYGGFTVVIDHLDNMHINYPKPNSVVIFNSRLPHVGLEPTSHCTTQRVTMAHKFKIVKE
jgi:Rps23 Pro-64 3,4-dihydroxylase Tpa1-like proline 4-hydroxylase